MAGRKQGMRFLSSAVKNLSTAPWLTSKPSKLVFMEESPSQLSMVILLHKLIQAKLRLNGTALSRSLLTRELVAVNLQRQQTRLSLRPKRRATASERSSRRITEWSEHATKNSCQPARKWLIWLSRRIPTRNQSKDLESSSPSSSVDSALTICSTEVSWKQSKTIESQIAARQTRK